MSWLSQIFSSNHTDDSTLLVNSRLIDVRSRGEFASGHIDGAFNLPLDQLAQEIPRAVPDKNTPLLIYCQSGMRSGQGCMLLKQLGYVQVSNGGGVSALALKLGRPIRRSI